MKMGSDATAKQGADLLLLLHWMTTRDRGAPGFSGTIAVGVRHANGESWWRASFGARAESELIDRCPVDVDVSLLFSEDEANRIMDQGTLAASLGADRVVGDRELFFRFIERYMRKRSALDLRSSG
jgi:hypothetical protein